MTLATHTQTSAGQTWTDQLSLLNRLYGATIDTVRGAAAHIEAGDAAAVQKAALRARRLILEIVAGLDPSFGDIPEQVNRLCEFCLQQLEQPTAETLRAVDDVLTPLAEGFLGITEEVGRLEAGSELPSRETRDSLIDQVI